MRTKYIWLVRDKDVPKEGLFFEREKDAREWYQHIGGRGDARIERMPYLTDRRKKREGRL